MSVKHTRMLFVGKKNEKKKHKTIAIAGALPTPMSSVTFSHVLVDHVRLSCQNYEMNG